MSTEAEHKEKLEKLAQLRKSIYDSISEYNLLAHDMDHCERLGLVSSEFDQYEEDALAEYNGSIQEYMKDSYDRPYVRFSTPGVKGYWFPSDLNC